MRKLTLLIISLLVTLGTMAQVEGGKYYRIKDNASGYYLNAANHDTHATGPNGGVNVVALNEASDEMIFLAEPSGDGFKLKTKSGYYINGQEWNVDANSTTDGAVLLFEQVGDNYHIKWVSTAEKYLGQTKYFKVENVSGTIYPFCDAAVGVAATWTIEQVTRSEYVHNTNSINRKDSRRLNSFTITDGERNLAVSSIQTSQASPVYVDKTDNVLKTVPGATLSFSAFLYGGNWMHAYAYIDYNKDGFFALFNNNNGEGTGEIVSYNYYNGKTITGADGNTNGYALTTTYVGNSKAMPAFTLPANLPNGEYRVRVKVDWNNIDADYGDMSISSGNTLPGIAHNGGCQCDFTIKVTNEFAKAELGTLVEQLNAYPLGAEVGLYSSSEYSNDDLNEIKNNASNFYNGIDDNTPVADIQGYISTLNTVLPTVSLNVPAAGKHYRLKNAVSGNYMSAKSDYSVKMLTNGGAALSTIFFLGENNTLYSYTQEKYLDCQGKNLIAEAKNGEFGPAYNTPTANVVTYKNNSYWTFGNRADGVSIDRGNPDVNDTGYNWKFEEVKTLPVAAIGDTGYTTLEAAKAAALATTEAVEIVLLAGSDETIVFPANVTINKNGFTADKLAVAVAKIGETLYASIEAAAAAAQAGQTVVLLKDTEETLVLPAGVKLDKSNVTAPNVNEAAAKVGDVLYATLAEAANVATKGKTVTILRSTDETAVFAYGVVIEKAEGVVAPNATNEVAVDVPADVVGNIVSNNSGVETETVNGVVGALQNNEAVISNTPTNLPDGAKLVVTLVNIIFESEAPAKVVYDVTPKNGDAEIEPTEEITFRLPVPANWKYAKVYHATALKGIYPVQEGNYVEVASQDFSEFAVEIAEPVAKIGVVDYYTFEAALADAQANETITLVADVTCAEKPVFNNGGVVNVDINGHKFVSSEKARVRCVASADGAVASNNIKFVRGFGWEAYYNANEKFRVFPILDEAVAYKSGTNAANIYPYEDVVQNKDITFCTTGEQTSTALTNDAGYKTSWDLNGYTVLQETAAGNPLESTVLGEFTLLDSSAEKTGKWIAGAYNGNTGGGPAFIVNRADAHLILQGGTISIARNGDVVNTGGLINTIYGTLTVDGATLQMDDQYGIMAWGGNVVVNSGEFVLGENNSSSVFAMKYYSDASVTINANLGGTLYAHSSATATVNVAGVKYYVSGTDYVAPAVGEGLVAQGGVVGYPVAKIGETGYLTLEAALAEAQDGETVTLLADVTYTKATGVVNDSYVDGLVYDGDKSFTVDFAGHTITENGEINDYLVYLKNTGEKDNEITFKNGTIAINEANENTVWAAITVGSNSSTHKTTLNLNAMKVINGNPNDESNQVIRIRNGATVNLNDGTLVTSNRTSYGVVAQAASTLNINSGARVVHTNSGTTGGNLVYTAVSGNGTINIYDGAVIESDKYAIHNMTSGNAVINIYGGTITALVAVHAATNGGAGETATVNIKGGTFNGAMEEYTNTANIHVSGGTFTVDVTEFCADGFVCEANGDGTYGVQFASYIVLPDGVNSSNYAELFGDNTVTDGTNYYATLQAAVETVAGQANAVLYCKPGADVGSLQHAPVTNTLTVYGNGADVTGDTERDFDLGNTDPSGGKDITADMTLTVKHLNGCGAWGAKATEHTVNLVFENCANMGKVFITGTTGTLNITMTNCAFEGVIKEAVYSNADGAITLINVAFSNLNKAVNLNHKAAGTQTVTIDGCTFTNCGADVAKDQIPVRVLSTVEGGKSVLAVTGSTFTGTPDGGADILLDYGVGLTTASVSGTAANVVVEKENNVGTTTAVNAEETVEFTTALPVAQVGETKYMTLADAVAAATEGATITMLGDVTLTETVTLPAGITFNGNGKFVDGEVWAAGNLTFVGYTKVAKFNAGYNKPVITIGEGACLETSSGRMVIGHGATFNITGNIENAKTADVAALTPSLIIPGASFTGAGVTFNVTNAYIKATAYCSSKNSNANDTFNFNVTNSVWEQTGTLVFSAPTNGMDPTFNLNLVNSVLNSTSHLVFAVTKGEIVIDNSNVNVGTARQIENRSTMTIKNGSVVNGAVATSENATNPGTLIVENATYAVTGEFSGSKFGTGTIIFKKGASFTAGSITKANITIDATGMEPGEVAITANLANLAGELKVINNDLFEASVVDGKIVLSSKSLEGEGTADAPFVINTIDDLRLFAMSVNAGNDYAGKLVKLGASVDLSAQAVALMSTEVTPNWEPIGTKAAPFKGTFDGNGETISNMIVVGEANQGFFGYADAATIKNLNLENVTVTGTDCVGAVAGQVYSVSLIDNCHVSGNIKVEGQTYVGGITGKYYTKVSNCSVIGDGAETSYVKGVYVASDFEGDNIGGIMGHCGENNNLAGNTVKNITVSGTRKVGGIVGIADQNTDVTGCVVENVVVETTATAEYADSKVTSMSIGALIGQYQAAGSNPDGTVTGCTVKNVTFNNVNDVTVDVGPIVGGARGSSSGMLAPSTAVTASGNNVYMTTITGSTNDYLMVAVAKIGEKNYYVLDEAFAAAEDGETVTLVNNVALETPVVISGKTLTLDLGAYTIEDKSTAVLTAEDDVWAIIDLKNGANLTVCGTGTIKANYANVQEGEWTGMAYCINVDKTSKLTVDGGNFINGNGGVQTRGEVVVNGGTFVSHNGGTCIMATYTDAKVTVNGGTFKDSVEESDLYTGSGAVWAGFGAKIEINGGTFDFAADPSNNNVVWTLFPAQNAIAGTGVNAEMAVSGGTFVNFNPAEDVIVDYSPSTGFTFGSVVAEGYTVVENGDGTYGIEEKVELPEVVITDIKGSLTDSDPDLTFALNFAIKDVENLDPEYLEKLFAQYGSWYTDYVLTISGLTDENVTFNANGGGDGYLAGQYDAWSENWVSVPFEDVTLANGASIYIMEYAAKLMGQSGLRFTLAEVAEIVQNFDCGVYFTPEFLAANPGLKVDLHLKVFTEDAEGNKVNDINVATNNFDVEDYVAIVHAAGKQTKYCTTLADAVAAAADGATITMLSDVELTEAVKVVGKAITLDLNGKTVSGTCNSNQGHLIYIENGAGLTVKDGAVDGGGKLTYAQGTSNVGWTVAVMGNLTLESGTIELTGEWSIGYAVDVRPNAWGVAYTEPSMFTMNGGNVVSSDGAVRVASSSSDQYANVSASFVMNGGEIDAAWDGVFIQQSNTAYDVLNFTINDGTIKSGLNPVRVYGPAPTSYVNGQECMSINFNGGTMTYTGTETREWVIDGVLRVGGGSSIETIVENGNITASEAFAQAQALPEGYIWEQDGETYKVVEVPAIAKVGETKYMTLADAVAAAEGETVTLLADVALTESLVIAAGKEVVLDLNGKTVSMADASGKGAYAIKNNGNLTIVDNSDAETGKITFNSTTPDNSFGYATSTIGNGGSLTVESGTIENTTVGGASYAIDGIWHTDEASLTINGGTIVANKIAVRQVPFSATANNVVTVNGGTLTGATAGLQLFNINNDAKLAEVNIHGGEFNGSYAFYTSFTSAAASEDVTINIDGGEFNGYLFLYNGNNGSDEYPMTVSVTGGTFNGGAYIYTKDANGDEVAIPSITGGTFANDVTVYCVDGYLCEANGDGTYGIVADPSYIAELIIDDAEGEPYTNDTEKRVGKLTYVRTLPAAGIWYPVFLPFDVPVAALDAELFDVARINDFHTNFSEEDGSIEKMWVEYIVRKSGTLAAGKPFLVRAKNSDVLEMVIELEDVTLYPADKKSTITVSSVITKVTFEGVYESLDAPVSTPSTRYLAVNAAGVWDEFDGYSLNPFRVMMTLRILDEEYYISSAASLSVGARVIGEENEDGTTTIYDVEVDRENCEDLIFDLQGRRVLEPEKGCIYIKNGKKIIF